MNKGFTLVELVIVIAVLLILSLATITLVKPKPYKDRILDRHLRLIKIQLIRHKELYGYYPGYADETVTNPSDWDRFMLPQIDGGRFFKDVPKNPYYSGEAKDGWRLDKEGSSFILRAINNEGEVVGSIKIEEPFIKISVEEVNDVFKP